MKVVKVLTAVFIVSVFVSTAMAGVIDLPKTGQKTIYAPGDDGDLQKGITWPNPRFTGKIGCVTDNLTGLMWAGFTIRNRTIEEAYDSIEELNNGYGHCGYHDWRLPTVNELESLMNIGEVDQVAWLESIGLENMDGILWGRFGSSKYAVYGVAMSYGTIRPSFYSKTANIMMVRGITNGPARVWKTHSGNDNLNDGVPWPSPRFTDNGNGTVTDNLTGLTWLKNVNCGGRRTTWINAFTWVNELNKSGTMNGNNCGDTSNSGSHQTDWRLPNRKELWSLANSDIKYTGLFINANFSYDSNYWTSSTHAGFPDGKVAWVFRMLDSELIYAVKDRDYDAGYVWPVRGGNESGTFTLTVNKTGSGSGIVTDNFSNINCGQNCSATYSSGTAVTLTAVSNTGSAFASWGDECSICGTNQSCQIVIDSDKTCSATFTLTMMPVPTGQLEYSYDPLVSPVVDNDPSQAKPFGVGDVATGGNTLSLRVGLPEFQGPVDVYLAIYAPEIDPNIWMIKSDLTLEPLSIELNRFKWREYITGPINETLYGNIPVNILPSATYTLYIAITSPNNPEKFYLWSTYFTVP